jgi:hypothetical protein
LIGDYVSLKIVHSLFTLTLISSKQPSYTQLLFRMNRIINDIQLCVSGYYHLHPDALLPLNC